MTLKKALELLETLTTLPPSALSPDLKDALSLGIEALKRVQSRRELSFSNCWCALPGETLTDE